MPHLPIWVTGRFGRGLADPTTTRCVFWPALMVLMSELMTRARTVGAGPWEEFRGSRSPCCVMMAN